MERRFNRGQRGRGRMNGRGFRNCGRPFDNCRRLEDGQGFGRAGGRRRLRACWDETNVEEIE